MTWVPRDAEAITAAATNGELEETSSFDVKRGLPATAKRNVDLAIDVAAMSTDGGALLYGVDEDEHGRPTIPRPLPLAGAADRVGQIIETSIAEAPYVEAKEYPTADDPSVGYLLVTVPRSARAPHQVTVGGELRFYGRGPKGNRPLIEGEIARLYQRRQAWEVDRGALLDECLRRAPYGPTSDLGYVHSFARPVPPDTALFDRARRRDGGREALLDALRSAAVRTGPRDGYGPSLHSNAGWERRGADTWRLRNAPDFDPATTKANYAVFCDLEVDGRGYLFCGRAAERDRPNGPASDGGLIIFESIIAGNLASFLSVMGAYYREAGYAGPVDVGFAVTDIEGGVTSRSTPMSMWDYPTYKAESFSRTEMVAAGELGDPEVVALRLLRDLFDATTGREDFDPFA